MGLENASPTAVKKSDVRHDAVPKASPGVSIPLPYEKEDVFRYIKRIKGNHDHTFYKQIIGAANPFKEGDRAVGVAADCETSRQNARKLLAHTRLSDIRENPLHLDGQEKLIRETVDKNQYEQVKDLTIGQLKGFLLSKSETEIKDIIFGLTSDVIGCTVKLMDNDELCLLGRKVFNPLPGSMLGARGYMSARIQPNSPTDNVEDIIWQVFNAWSFGVGDLMLGTNPVDSTAENIARVETALRDILTAFGLEDVMPWCVLAHIDVQDAVERKNPGTTAIYFQSLAGTEDANKTFDLTLQKLTDYADKRTGRYGFYFETGQGADFTNGHGAGFDMVIHESRKYGLARALKQRVEKALGSDSGAWVHVNDVAGFIGPEVFKIREQLVRTCLEDIVMGKLHGLTIGLDICSTLHMSVSLDDLDWCIDQIMPANPGYLMALPTKNDPMLSYLTTAFQDHVRIREKFGYKVNDVMWDFFKKLGIIDQKGKPTKHFGDPVRIYRHYCRSKGDIRSGDMIRAEGRKKIREITARGVPLSLGHGENIWDINPDLDQQIRSLYEDAKVSIWAEFTEDFKKNIPDAVFMHTQSADRDDYIARPVTGENLSTASVSLLEQIKARRGDTFPNVQIVISDGLNARAVMDAGHVDEYLPLLRDQLTSAGYSAARENIVITRGRVRAGYRIGEMLFGRSEDTGSPKAVLHIIGERPGSGHHNFSVYIAAARVSTWRQKSRMDHDKVRLVSGISDTSLTPEIAARQTTQILQEMMGRLAMP